MSTTIHKVAWICLKDRKVLMAKSHGKALFYIPGGKVEAGETEHQALAREIEEEVSVQLIDKSIHPFKQFEAQADGKLEGTLVQISTYFAEYEGNLAAAAEIETLEWMDGKDSQRVSTISKLILSALHADNWIG